MQTCSLLIDATDCSSELCVKRCQVFSVDPLHTQEVNMCTPQQLLGEMVLLLGETISAMTVLENWGVGTDVSLMGENFCCDVQRKMSSTVGGV